MTRLKDFTPKPFPHGTHKKYGRYEHKKNDISYMWVPEEEIWRASWASDGTLEIGCFFDNKLSYYYSPICARRVAINNPDLYCKIHNISHGDEHYALYQAWRIKHKIEEAQDANGTPAQRVG